MHRKVKHQNLYSPGAAYSVCDLTVHRDTQVHGEMLYNRETRCMSITCTLSAVLNVTLTVQVHGEMLYQTDALAGEALRTPGSRRGTPAPWERNSEDNDGAAARQRLAAFRKWLRLLLFQLLMLAVQVPQPSVEWCLPRGSRLTFETPLHCLHPPIATAVDDGSVEGVPLQQVALHPLLCLTCVQQGDEGSSEVWDAALGCLLHMTCRDGSVVASAVRGLPPATARGLLQCCQTLGW